MITILSILFFVGLVAVAIYIKKYEDNLEKSNEQKNSKKACKQCGQILNPGRIINTCSNCIRKQTAKWYRFAGITIITISFITGLILADTFREEKIDSEYFEYSYLEEKDIDEYTHEEFNIQLLLTTCICGLMFGLPLIEFSSIIYRLDLMIDK